MGIHKTNNLDDTYLGSGKLLKRAILKYGKDNFKKEILHIFDNEEDMKNKEREIVDENFLKGNVYNLDTGGNGGFFYCNATITEENIQKRAKNGYRSAKSYMTDPVKNRVAGLKVKELGLGIFSEEAILRRKNVWKGRKHKPETRAKMSQAKKDKYNGQHNPVYGRFWITNGIENRMVQPQTIIPENWYKGRTLSLTKTITQIMINTLEQISSL